MFFRAHIDGLKIGRSLFLITSLLLLLACVLTAEKKYGTLVCKKIQINVLPTPGQQFVTAHAIHSYLLASHSLLPHTTRLQDINTRAVESILKSHTFVRSCSAFKTWKQVLKITILPKKALARLVCYGEADCYIDEIGQIMPLSADYTPRVVLLTSKKLSTLGKNSSLCDLPWAQPILAMLRAIDQAPFWKAQIIHIGINQADELVLSTQLSGHKIYFGKAENMERKMEKLHLVYNVILPYKGWNAYKKITLKFDNQIVCE